MEKINKEKLCVFIEYSIFFFIGFMILYLMFIDYIFDKLASLKCNKDTCKNKEKHNKCRKKE